VITAALSAVVERDRATVWRALTDPDELVSWDGNRIAAIEIPDAHPAPGGHVRWRSRLGSVQLVQDEKTLEVVSGERLHSRVKLGSLRFEETWTLFEEKPATTGSPVRTRVSLKIVASSSVPVIGAVVDRFEVKRMVVERIDQSLRSLQKWLEA